MTRQNPKPATPRKPEPRRISPSAEADLRVPPYRGPVGFATIEEAMAAYQPPVTANGPSALAEDCADGIAGVLGGLVDHAAELGQYPTTSFVGYGVLQQISQNAMIRTCIQVVADDCTREWIEVKGGDETDPETLSKLGDAVQRFKLQRLWTDAIAMMGYMGGALIYIDTGTDDPEVPLRVAADSAELQKGGHLKFVLVDPVNVSPGEYNASDPLRADFMKDPIYWLVMGRRVHHSRLIILRDNLPPTLLRPAYNFLGIPQAQLLWDYVLHWNGARVAAADILDKLNLMVFQTSVSDLLSAPGGVAQLDSKMLALTRYRSNDSVMVCDKTDEDLKNVTLTISGVTDVARQALEFVAAVNRTPAVKLLGISPSGFNATGESDIRNYYDHIRSKQELLRDGIQRALDCIQLHTAGELDPSITFEFNRLGADDAASDAQTTAAKVGYLNTLLQGNVISAEEARQVVRQDPRAGLDFLGEELPEMDEGSDVAGGDDLAGLMAGLGDAPEEPLQKAQQLQPQPQLQDPPQAEGEVQRA